MVVAAALSVSVVVASLSVVVAAAAADSVDWAATRERPRSTYVRHRR
jgi:hypothetical protein